MKVEAFTWRFQNYSAENTRMKPKKEDLISPKTWKNLQKIARSTWNIESFRGDICERVFPVTSFGGKPPTTVRDPEYFLAKKRNHLKTL